MVHDLFLGFIKVHVLHHAAEEPVYGLALIQELHRHGYEIGAGTIYPLLHSLEISGYLRRHDTLVEGKIRKYYTITAGGRKALRAAQKKIEELVDEVLRGAPRSSGRRQRR